MDTRVVTGGGPDLEEIRALFREYAQWVAVDLSFQGFAQELAGLPGDYVAPHGILLLSVDDGVSAGCIGVHEWQAKTCEMKRLYVRPRFQGLGCGRLLAERAIAWAVQAGYQRMLLDTLPAMGAAQGLYERLGFRDTPPYRPNPVQGARFMALELQGNGSPK